jgi:glycosidase
MEFVSILASLLNSILMIHTEDWSNKTQIQFCQLVGLADLKTESDYVRQTLVDHLNDILSLGAAGFRIDAAKHVPVSDLQNIIGRLSRAPYVTSEVVGSGAPIPPNDYSPLGTVTITQSYTALMNGFTGSAGLTSLNGWEKGRK